VHPYGLFSAETYTLFPLDDFKFEPTEASTHVALFLTLIPVLLVKPSSEL
jgi:hypothetical protein